MAARPGPGATIIRTWHHRCSTAAQRHIPQPYKYLDLTIGRARQVVGLCHVAVPPCIRSCIAAGYNTPSHLAHSCAAVDATVPRRLLWVQGIEKPGHAGHEGHQGGAVDHVDEHIIELEQIRNVEVPAGPTAALPVHLHPHLRGGPRCPSSGELPRPQHTVDRDEAVAQKELLLR
jgi:hypothetical protein